MRSLVGFPLDSLNLYHQTEVPMQNLKKEDIKQEVFDLYDDYVHSRVTRRDFVQRLSAYAVGGLTVTALRSEEHTSELQSLMRISYAVFCLKKKRYTIIQRQQPV